MQSDTPANTDDLFTVMELVTPDMAAKYLERNTKNRPVSRAHVRDLAQELEQGRWLPTHQGIAFDRNGVLVDGQHRLLAICVSGIAAELQVTRGVDPETFHAIDQHRRRTAGQILVMGGVTKDAPRVAAMARAIRQVVHGEHHVSNTAASAYSLEHRSTIELFLPVARKYTPAVGAAFAWATLLGWDETVDAAVRLVEKMWSGPDDPMRALDRRTEDKSWKGQGQAGIKLRFDIALNCLLAVHEGKPMKVARSIKPDYAAIERASMRPQAPRTFEEELDHQPTDWSAAPGPRSLAAGLDPEMDELVAQQVAKYRSLREEAGLAVPVEIKSGDETVLLGDGGTRPEDERSEQAAAVGEGRVVRRRARTQADRDAALDAEVRAANGR